MKKSALIFLGLFVLVFLISAGGHKAGVIPENSSQIDAVPAQLAVSQPEFGNIPLYFIPNEGQVDKQALYYAKARDYTLWMTEEGLVFDSTRSTGKPPHEQTGDQVGEPEFERDVSRLQFLNTDPEVRISSIEPASHKANYFIGNDRSKWHPGIATSKAVLYKGLYDSIDLKVYGVEKQIEYDWVVHPGGEVSDIGFDFTGVEGTRIDDDGNLMVTTKFGELKHTRPVSFQIIEGRRVDVEARFSRAGDNSYGFRVDSYNKEHTLIIDPMTLLYSTFIGTSDYEVIKDIAVYDGHIYITGYTSSSDFPTVSAYDSIYSGGSYDIFVTKFSSDGSSLDYSTFIGGSDSDYAYGMDVYGGAVYLTGYSGSTDYPMHQYYDNSLGGSYDVIVTGLSSDGSSLYFSTYIGGSSSEFGFAIQYSGGLILGYDLYITGYTLSSDFPTQSPYDGALGGSSDVFMARVGRNMSLFPTPSWTTSLEYSTYLGGSGSDYGYDIAFDDTFIYVVGNTTSSDFPEVLTSGGLGGSSDGFVTRFLLDGSALDYSMYLGGSSADYARNLAIDNSYNAYVLGYTTSSDFYTNNAYDSSLGGSSDLFVCQVSKYLNFWTWTYYISLPYSTFLGGSSGEYTNYNGIALDSDNDVYIIGHTSSSDFPTVNAYDTSLSGTYDAIIAKFDWGTSPLELDYSTLLGGSNNDYPDALAVDEYKTIYAAGYTYSSNFPTVNAYDETYAGNAEGFVSKLTVAQSDDLLGTYSTQGTYYRNSNSGYWEKLGTAASQIAAGDVDGDGIDDLLGIWSGQGGVWVRYSTDGTWAQLGTTADWITAGDMNGDGRDDLLGTWTGQGTYYRNSANGSWVSVASAATQIAAGDLDEDGTDDLLGIWPSQGGVWVKFSSSSTWTQLGTTADWIAAGDMNGDGKDDLLGSWSSQGTYYRDSDDGSWVKLGTAADKITAGDLEGDGVDDLAGIWSGQGGVWVKYSSNEEWTHLSSTAAWIDCGKMRSTPASLTSGMDLEAPIGGMAYGPPNAYEAYDDLSSFGPGGKNFRYTTHKNYKVGSQIDEARQAEVQPGPGEYGFAPKMQKNLIPKEKVKKEIRIKEK